MATFDQWLAGSGIQQVERGDRTIYRDGSGALTQNDLYRQYANSLKATDLSGVVLPDQRSGIRTFDPDGGNTFSDPQQDYAGDLSRLGYRSTSGINWDAPFQTNQSEYKVPFGGTTREAYQIMYPQLQMFTDPRHGELLQLGPYQNTGIDYYTGKPGMDFGDWTLLGMTAVAGAGLAGALPGTTSVFGGAAGGAGAGFNIGGTPMDLSGYMAGVDSFGAGGLAAAAGGGGYTPGVHDFYGSLAENAGIGSSAGTALTGSAATPWGLNPMTTAGGQIGGGMGDLWELITKATGGNPLGSLFNIGRGLYGMDRADKVEDLAVAASHRENPFGPYRDQYAQLLSQLYADPSRITKMPGYEAGLTAVERKMASQGYLGSGNMMAALHKYGGDFFNAETDRLATLSGAKFAPSGGNLAVQGGIAGAQLEGNSLNSLIYGALGMASPMGSNDPREELRRRGIILN